MKLIKRLRQLKSYRKTYRIKPGIWLHADTTDYLFSLIPTICFMPWIFRMPGYDCLLDIWWLNFHITIGRWENKGDE